MICRLEGPDMWIEFNSGTNESRDYLNSGWRYDHMNFCEAVEMANDMGWQIMVAASQSTIHHNWRWNSAAHNFFCTTCTIIYTSDIDVLHCPGMAAFGGVLLYQTPATDAGFGIKFVGTIEKEGINLNKPGCSHEYVPYTGLVETYEYCKKCDQKKGP